MEPSVRSSSFRPTECKLRRTDSALHETAKRFVESLDDMRISQYADLNFAASKFSNNKWYWLLPEGQAGFLVFLPKMPVIWIDEQLKKSYKLNMRVSSHVYEKSSLFIASLNMNDSLLRLEDVWVYSGKNIRQSPFSQRWETLLDFFAVSFKQDTMLQGINVKTAEYYSLASIKDWDFKTLHNYIICQGEKSQRRFRVQLKPNDARPVEERRPVQKKEKRTVEERRPVQEKRTVEERKQVQENTATAIPHPDYPDTYNLFMNGVKKGYAAVQDIELSKKLKQANLQGKEMQVTVEWNSEFSMFEICDLIPHS